MVLTSLDSPSTLPDMNRYTSLLVLIALIALSGCSPASAKLPSTFVIVGEGEKVGRVTLYTIQHRETGKRYILADQYNGGVFIQPLN